MVIPGKPLLKKIISTIVVGAIFYFLFDSLFANYQKLSEYKFHVVWSRLFISFSMLLFVFLFNPVAWRMILNEMREEIDFRRAFAILYVSQLGKYLPGKIWSYVGQVYLADKEGISKSNALISSVLLQVLSIATGIYIFLISLLFWDKISLFLVFFILVSLLVVSLAAVHFGVLDWIIKLVVNRLLKRKTTAKIRPVIVIRAGSILMLSWVAYGVAYYHFVNSFYPIDLISAIKVTGIYTISWLIGYASVLTPGGLGIREGAQAYLLNIFFPLPISIIISLACRAWLTIGEITVASISALFLMTRNRLGIRKIDMTEAIKYQSDNEVANND